VWCVCGFLLCISTVISVTMNVSFDLKIISYLAILVILHYFFFLLR